MPLLLHVSTNELSKKNISYADIQVTTVKGKKMSKNLKLFKSILYIVIQLLSLWGIFLLLTDSISPSKDETIGVIILTLIFFISVHKNIKILKFNNFMTAQQDKYSISSNLSV